MRKRLTEQSAKYSAAGLRREISEDFKYDKKKIKHLQRILHNVTTSLGTLNSALNEFSRIKGPSISPDGLLGGLGYIMPIKSVKEGLTNAVHNLSDIADSIADELSNPHWHAEDDKETKKLIKEKEEVEEETQKVLDAPDQGDLEQPDEIIQPEDVLTSSEVFEGKTASYFADAIKKGLVKFNSAGKKN